MQAQRMDPGQAACSARNMQPQYHGLFAKAWPERVCIGVCACACA